MLLTGWVIRMQSGFFTIQTAEGIFTCQMRGKLKRERRDGDVIAVGDQVKIMPVSGQNGMIEEILPRNSAIIRVDPRPRGEYRQVLLANIDQLLLVFSCANPPPRLRMLDRFLVIAGKQNVPAVIVANKIDLIGLREANATFGVYARLGYPVIYTSSVERRGLGELREQLTGRISGLAGPSGVGKSSLLNALQPDLDLSVREVSEMTEKGRHTTVVREMFALDGGGYVCDLPGLKSLALWDTQPEELDGYFPELSGLVQHCAFSDCTHRDEPGCAVTKAVQEGKVDPRRYDSYLRMRYGGDSYAG